MKRLLSLLLALVLCLSAVFISASAASPFTDVSSDQWYYDDVISAYELGLINGKTETQFKPNDNLTYAEAVKLAACMHQLYAKLHVTLTNGDPWYQPYVDYCKENKIITKDYPWNEPATRAGYMEIFAVALPDIVMDEKNTVPDGSIPDVPMDHPQAEAIYKLYRIGIVQGVDDAYNCKPAENIKRSEVASIVNRMMDRSKRVSICLDSEKLFIKVQPEDAVDAEQVTFRVVVTGGKPPYSYQWQIGRYWTFNYRAHLLWDDLVYSTGGAYYTQPEITLYRGKRNYIVYSGNPLVLYRCVITDSAGQVVTTDAVRIISD